MRYSIKRDQQGYRLMYQEEKSGEWRSVFDQVYKADRFREVVTRGMERAEIDDDVSALVEFRVRRNNSERNG